MEFVEGETLHNLIKRLGRLEVKLTLEIATQVAAGLAAVHEQNLVHRDIKPTNIMVRLKEERSLTAKIIDLGLAKTLVESASEAGISMPGAFAGTSEFASPEQFAGDGVDIRSDLYSLGVTLWEMLIGRTPFRGSSVEVMYQHQHAPLPVEQLNGIPQPRLRKSGLEHRCCACLPRPHHRGCRLFSSDPNTHWRRPMFRVSIFILAVLYDVLWNISSQVVENGQIFEQSANTTLGHEKENLVQFAGNEFFRNCSTKSALDSLRRRH